MEALTDFGTVGSVAPSSRYLTEAMVRPLPLKRARIVVEVGPGTGVMTRALLEMIPFEATLLAFEINPRFSRYLKSNVPDSRLEIINASAETFRSEVHRHGHESVDAVVSSLALGLMPTHQREAFLSEVANLLDENGVFTQYQYIHSMQVNDGQLRRFDLVPLLRRYFRSVQRTMIWRNLPPAFVFVCKGPLGAESGEAQSPITAGSRSNSIGNKLDGFSGRSSLAFRLLGRFRWRPLF
jgi:phosphatidylethanolamine/phosphatidyl-N-methylethanolamine N-methyltransferase